VRSIRCQVCQSEIGVLHRVREMALGTRDEFLYFECSRCGCLSLTEVPADLDRYYTPRQQTVRHPFVSKIRHLRNALYLSPLSFLVNWKRYHDLGLIHNIRLNKTMSLLDVDCGMGDLIGDLRELGYDAHGIDPYLAAEVRDRFGTRVECKALADVDRAYDVILFRNSLEHMPIHTLQLARERMRCNGICIARIPLLGWAWRTYTVDWVQLNAPRHLFIHSMRSFSLLAERSGFRIEKTIFDSNEFQFWASDSYQRGVPLAKIMKPTRSQRKRMLRIARSLNLKQEGDCAQFYLRAI